MAQPGINPALTALFYRESAMARISEMATANLKSYTSVKVTQITIDQLTRKIHASIEALMPQVFGQVKVSFKTSTEGSGELCELRQTS